MLSAEKKTILRTLVALAWADGRVEDEELDVVDVLLAAFYADEDDADEIRAFAAQPRTLDDVDVSGLSPSDRELCLQQAVFVSYTDGNQSLSERAVIGQLVGKLGLETEHARRLIHSAEERARALFNLA